MYLQPPSPQQLASLSARCFFKPADFLSVSLAWVRIHTCPLWRRPAPEQWHIPFFVDSGLFLWLPSTWGFPFIVSFFFFWDLPCLAFVAFTYLRPGPGEWGGDADADYPYGGWINVRSDLAPHPPINVHLSTFQVGKLHVRVVIYLE